LKRTKKNYICRSEKGKRFGFTATELEEQKHLFILRNLLLKKKDKTTSDNFVQEYVQLF
jgi:hypothetical protein